MLAAASIAVLGTAGIVALSSRDETPPPPAALPAASQPATGLHLATPTVTLDAASLEVIIGDLVAVPTEDLVVDGDPGMPNEYTSLELTWHNGDIEQRVHLYFASDGVDWWVSEIRTYDGQQPGDWFEPIATGEFFRSPLGTPFVGDLDLPNLQIHDMTLDAFLPPDVCNNTLAPIALLADYPTIDAPVGGFGASFQMIDTATCTPVAVAPYEFDYVSDDPTIVKVEYSEPIDGYPEIKTRVGLTLAAPGTTTVHATARNTTGEIVSTADMHVTVGPAVNDEVSTDTTTPPDTVDPNIQGLDQTVESAQTAAEIERRLGYLSERLSALGYSTTAADTNEDGVTTIEIRSDTDGRTIMIKMMYGSPAQPENHNRVPITVDEQNDLTIRGHVDSNSGWTFEVAADRSPDDATLPTVDQLQNLLYTLDP